MQCQLGRTEAVVDIGNQSHVIQRNRNQLNVFAIQYHGLRTRFAFKVQP